MKTVILFILFHLWPLPPGSFCQIPGIISKWLTFKAKFCFYHLAWLDAEFLLNNFEKNCTEEDNEKVYLNLKKINVNIM